MNDQKRWDLFVLGGGTAGIVAANTAARLGASVLLVERHRTGGDCLWTGCVPSKALLAAADAAAVARNSARFGVHVDGVRVDFGQTMDHVRAAIAEIAPIDSPETLEGNGVTVRSGTGRFVGEGVAEIDGEPINFTQAVITTGATPAMPPIPGLDQVAALTSETVWDLTELPGRLIILGGGSIGCELGQGMGRLGAQVTVLEGADRILPHEDEEAAAAVHRALEADGITVSTGNAVAAVTASRPGSKDGRVELEDGTEIDFDQLLVATGRTPSTHDLGLDRIDVEVDKRGFIVVDDHLRCTNPRIWAAGDLTGHPQFTHTAGTHGSLASSNAVLGVRRSVETTAVPRVTYTQPEVAAVGVETGQERDGVRILSLSHERVDRAVTEGETGGVTKFAVDRRGRILGATVVGPRAGETLGELAVAIRRGLRTRDLAGIMHPYPTWNDGPWNNAVTDVQQQLQRPMTKRALRTLASTRRWWLERRAP